MSLANRMAITSEHVHALTVMASEFPELARDFAVSSVPRTVVNRSGSFVGALPEAQFVAGTLELAGVSLDDEPGGRPPS